ncbi:MAG: hypothetical protein ACTS6G_00475 [Candidatus Hodgkinia cicadicola]
MHPLSFVSIQSKALTFVGNARYLHQLGKSVKLIINNRNTNFEWSCHPSPDGL